MKETSDLLAYCGLYCGDCAGYSGEIADAAKNLMKGLAKYEFSRTAKHLFPEKLRHYDGFCEMLGFISGLKCPTICREREDSGTTCKIRKCCRDRGFFACHECDDFETCERLKSLEILHGDSCVRNLKAIKEMGLETTIATGERHRFGGSDAVTQTVTSRPDQSARAESLASFE